MIAEDRRHGDTRIGRTAVLPTWDQKLRFYSNVQMVVPNTGFDVGSDQWKVGRGALLGSFEVLASLYRRRFLE